MKGVRCRPGEMIFLTTFITTFNIVMPVFLIIALGCGLRMVGIVDESGCKKMNKLAFDVLVPALVFYNIYTTDPQQVMDFRILGFGAVSIAVTFLLLILIIPRIEPDAAKRGVMIQGTFRSSFVVLGMGLAASMYPGQSLGITAMLSTVVAPMFNGLSVVALEIYSNKKPDVRRIIRGIITNPLILASVLALLMLLTGIRLPALVETVVDDVAATATTLSLLVLGGSFRFEALRHSHRQLFICCLGKLVILPLIFIPIAVALGFRQLELLSLLILFGSPTTVTSHIMAYNAGADDQLAGQIVVFSTCLSVLSLFGFIYVLLTLGLL